MIVYNCDFFDIGVPSLATLGRRNSPVGQSTYSLQKKFDLRKHVNVRGKCAEQTENTNTIV